MKKNLLVLIVIIFSMNVGISQDFVPHKSIHQLDLEKYDQLGYKTDAEWDAYNKNVKMPQQTNSKTCQLDHIVFGWHPYWMGTSYNSYEWDKLSDLAYFSYEVDYTDGSAVSTHNFATANVVDVAKSNGVRVHLTVNLFGHFDAFFANSSATSNLITTAVAMAKSRGIDGINIDFEGMGSDNKAQFSTFMHNLATELHSEIPGSMLSVCLYAVDWNGVFDFTSLNNDVDLYAIMGYDYYYAGSSTAGPTSQQYTMDNFAYTQTRSISYYQNKGAPSSKLILGVPYYGYDWKTTSSSVPAATSGSGSSRTYKVVKDNANGYFSSPQTDANSMARYYVYTSSGNTRQCWTDDEITLENHYKLVHQTGIAGIGIWALGYDNGYTQLWDLIGDYFTNCYVQPSTETIWDLGGPLRDYNNHEDYTYTIQPPGATGLTLNFSQFDVESNYDYLYIYDGTSTASTLIGKYTGTNSPGLVTASGNALTIRFTSDGATVKPGWTATWNATVTSVKPTTNVTAPEWATTDFNVTYSDNIASGSISDKYFQVLDKNGTEWRANANFGYLNDNFATSINSEWTQQVGTWTIDNGAVKQSDDGNSNTNLFINATQNSSNAYLYSWKMKLSGVAGNRRAGIHFFCDDATLSNRGNNYMVYYRADNNKVQIYEYTNNSMNLKTDIVCTINPNQWYDCKVSYNPTTGEIKAFLDGNLISSWTDPTPITTGNSVSLRTGNAIGYFDDFQMFKSRTNSSTVTVGATAEARYESLNSTTAACRINSVVISNANVFSDIAFGDVKIDRTAPTAIATLNDGTGTDVDVTSSTTELSANWTSSSDPNSGVAKYWYSIGTTAGGTNVVGWTDNGTQTSITKTGLSLTVGTTYYFSVKSENGVELFSTVKSSDGIQVEGTSSGCDDCPDLILY